MGMFDYVNHPLESCPKCGKPLGQWQTKDTADDELYLRTVDVADLAIGGTFYAHCFKQEGGCDTSVTYHLKPTGYTLERVENSW